MEQSVILSFVNYFLCWPIHQFQKLSLLQRDIGNSHPSFLNKTLYFQLKTLSQSSEHQAVPTRLEQYLKNIASHKSYSYIPMHLNNHMKQEQRFYNLQTNF